MLEALSELSKLWVIIFKDFLEIEDEGLEVKLLVPISKSILFKPLLLMIELLLIELFEFSIRFGSKEDDIEILELMLSISMSSSNGLLLFELLLLVLL